MSENELLDLAFDDANSRMEGAVGALERDLMVVRTGRAHTSLVDQLRVDYYGTTMALNQLATISTPEARLIAIQPWDKNAFEPITKAIQQSDIGINPQSDGILIRLAMPELTEERRRDLVKVVHQKTETARVAIRNVRRHVHDDLRGMQRDGDLSQDEERRAESELDTLTSQFIAKVDAAGSQKERELLEV